MGDPIRLRDLSPRLDSALDEARFDPPEGVEDEVWMRLESGLGIATDDAADEERVHVERRDECAPVRRAVPFGRVAVVVGALAMAAIAILAVRSSRSERIVTPSPTPVVTASGVATQLAKAAAPPEAPPPRAAPLPPQAAPPRAKPVIHAVEPRRNAEVHATAKPTALPADPPAEVTAAPLEAPRSEPPLAASRPSAAKAKSGLLPLEDGDLEAGATASEARRLVRAGNGREALAQLALIEDRWPQAMRHEERECLRIEALAIVGRTAQAAEAAAAFAETYPKSPFLPRVQRALTSGQRAVRESFKDTRPASRMFAAVRTARARLER